MNMKLWREYLITLSLAILLAMLVRHFMLTAYKVPTSSMQPTLKPGDFIFSYRLAYQTGQQVKRGDLVTFTYPNQPGVTYVKRVIALEGDHVRISQGHLYLNEVQAQYELVQNSAENPNSAIFDVYFEKNEEMSHQIILSKAKMDKDFGPFVVPPGEAFMLGDNRDASDDSRYWGTVPVKSIQGQVTFIWLSLDWQNRWGGDRYPKVRWERVFSSVH